MNKKPIDRDFLYQRYVVDRKSQLEIATELGVAQITVMRYLRIHSIPVRTFSEAQRQRNKSPDKRNQGSMPGETHANYKHGAYSQERVYRKMLVKDKCARCGSSDQLVIHHKNDNHYDNHPDNLEVLCSPCHSRYHKQRYWDKVKGRTG